MLLHALGTGARADLALLAEGIQVLGAAAGDLVPAQLGATEGAFALCAPSLQLTQASALSMAVVVHGTQLLFAALTLLVAVALRAAQVAAVRRAQAATPVRS